MTSEETQNHIKAIKAIARRLTHSQWEDAAQYAALQGSQLTVPKDYYTTVNTLYKRGYDDCVSWPDGKRKKGVPMVSAQGRLCWVRPHGEMLTAVAPLYIARYVYYRSMVFGESNPFTEVFVVTGPRWVQVALKDVYSVALVAQHTVGKILQEGGVRRGKKFVALRMDWI